MSRLSLFAVIAFTVVAFGWGAGSLAAESVPIENRKQLLVDATGGSLRVEVLGEQGGPIPGYDAASCQPLTKDELRALVEWSGRSLKELQGRTIRLRFQLDRARLFAFQVQPAERPRRPVDRVHAFYYPWYGNPATDGRYANWNHPVAVRKGPPRQFPGGDDIGADFYPQLGCYSSTSAETLDQHMRWLRRARVGVICVSWWGRGSFTNKALAPLFRAAEKHGIGIAFHIEPHIGPRGRNAETTREALRYLLDRFGPSPALYRDPARGKRPMIYVYDSYLTKAEDWSAIFSAGGADTIRGTPYDVIAIGSPGTGRGTDLTYRNRNE